MILWRAATNKSMYGKHCIYSARSQGHVTLIKSDSDDICNFIKISTVSNAVLLSFLFIKESKKYEAGQTFFNIDNKECYLSIYQIHERSCDTEDWSNGC